MVYIILSGYPPFYAENIKDLEKQILAGKYEFHPEYWSHVSDDGKDFIKQLLVVDPKQRMTSEEAFLHSWVCATDVYINVLYMYV